MALFKEKMVWDTGILYTTTDEVDFVVVCEDLGWLEVTVASVSTETFAVDWADTETFSVTDEIVFVVVCEDLGWLEVTVDSVDTETKVK